MLLNYHRQEEFARVRDGFTWHSVNLLPNPFAYYSYSKALIKNNSIDIVIGFSDTYFGMLAVLLAKKMHIKSLVDAYDNYESYLSWCKPLHYVWRYALRRASYVTAAGKHLLRKMTENRNNESTECILPMTADEQFVILDKEQCRKKLGLPLDKKIIGYCGSVHANRGMDVFFRVIEQLSITHKNYLFVITGRVQAQQKLPEHVMHLGYISDEMMPIVINSLDVMVSINQNSDFGSYSYPVKIYEALACNVPVLAANTPSVAEILVGDPSALFTVEQDEALSQKLQILLLSENTQKHKPKNSWDDIGDQLHVFLTQSQ
jgi:glycosyltransferase involved in cell wall biosynthesis